PFAIIKIFILLNLCDFIRLPENSIKPKNPTEITSGYIIAGLKKPLQIIRILQRLFITAITAAWRWRFVG
ncbi:hypothetical protein, partial [Cronobacter sakazakii]|uniref:hypothetical protein n=2 Tax=Cronobacter sakazakii TaxID=28141 RepID=UPI001F28C73F